MSLPLLTILWLLPIVGAVLVAFTPARKGNGAANAPKLVALAFSVVTLLLAVVGLGMSITVAPLTAAVLGAVPGSESGIGSAVNNAVARVAGLVTTSAVGLILGGAVSTAGLGRVALVSAALMVLGGMVASAGIRGGASAEAG